MSDYSKATDFNFQSIKIDGEHEIRSLVVSVEIYEHFQISAISGSLVIAETASSQFLADKGIEGNERIDIEISCGDTLFEYSGFINKIGNKTVTANGVSAYVIEFVSEVSRQDSKKRITRRFKNMTPKDVVESCIEKLNEGAEVPVSLTSTEINGLPMNFLASRWSPIKTINYVQKHAVPKANPGQSSVGGDNKNVENEARGTGAWLFYETLEGFKFGSSIEFLAGDMGKEQPHKLDFTLANKEGTTHEELKKQIFDFDLLQNNDTQTQLKGGAFKSTGIIFDIDKGLYKEQTWTSQLATDKQKEVSDLPTRYFLTTYSNESFNQSCVKAAPFEYDQKPLTTQQAEGTPNNLVDGRIQYTLPIRTDISVGDRVDASVFQASQESTQKSDEKHSGIWVVSGTAHHFMLGRMAAYTKITCVRATNQQSEAESFSKVDTIGQ